MHRFEQAFAETVVRLRWLFLLIGPALALALASQIPKLHFTNDYKVFFSPDNPQLRDFEIIEQTYTQDDNILFVLSAVQGDVFTPRVLDAVAAITEAAWQIPFSIRVDSLTNYQYTESQGDDLYVHDLVEDPKALTPQRVKRIKEIALSDPLLVNRVVPKDGSITTVNVTLQLPRKDETHEVPEVVAAAKAIAEKIRATHPGVEVRLSGLTMLDYSFNESSRHDMETLIPLSFTAMLVVLWLLLRSLSGVVATVLVIFFSTLAAMGSAQLFGYPITPPLASAPIIILTVAIAGSVHPLITFFHELAAGKDRRSALLEALRINLQPLFLTSITTIIGFLSFNSSEVPPFRQLGNVVAVGVFAAFLLSITFLPALMSLLPASGRHYHEHGQRLMKGLAEFTIRRRRGLLWGMGLVSLILIAFIPRNDLNDVFVHYFDESLSFRQDADFLDRHLGGLYHIDYSLDSGEPGGIAEPAFLARLDAFTQWLRRQPEVTAVVSITDIFKRLNKNMHGDDPAWYRLPESRELAAQYLLMYEMSLPFGLDLNNQIDVDRAATRVRVNTHVLSSKQVLALDRRIRDWLRANAPGIGVRGGGITLMFAHIGQRNIRSMLAGAFVALLLISAILMLALRSLRIGLVSLVPNLIPAAVGFGIWGLLVGEVGLSLSVVAGATLGIVVDDTVHFLSKYLRSRRELGLSPADGVRYAFAHVGMAMGVTTLVLVAGFLILALSDFYLNASMGLLTAIVLAVALIADYLLLPSLLLTVEDKRHATPDPIDPAPAP